MSVNACPLQNNETQLFTKQLKNLILDEISKLYLEIIKKREEYLYKIILEDFKIKKSKKICFSLINITPSIKKEEKLILIFYDTKKLSIIESLIEEINESNKSILSFEHFIQKIVAILYTLFVAAITTMLYRTRYQSKKLNLNLNHLVLIQQ